MKKLISLVSLFCLSVFLPLSVMGEPIDREAVVKRHRVCTTGTLLKSPAQVGNGKFAFGMDITGLQTFVPFNTLSDWSWHSFPLPEGMRAEDYRPVVVETHGKKIAYELRNPDQPELSEWLTKNPHRYNLGRIGFRLLREDGTEAREIDLGNARQEIDLWTGVVYSRFELNRKEVKVRTVCHPDKDMIGVCIESELLNDGNMSIYLDFPYPDGRYFKHYIGRYDTISGHTSTFEKLAPNSVRIARTMDDTHYYATLDWTGPATFSRESEKAHTFLLQPRHTSTFSFTCCFSPEPVADVTEPVASIERKSAASWEKYWRSGAAVDLSGSKDPRWLELERRIVLSQYLMRANESGLFPPQESGLVNNGWFGRFHFEMIWWHGVHYGLWNRMECFDNYLNVYKDFMPKALERAKSEGRSGARWPKCTGNFNREWPGSAHAYLIWHEPHPIYFAEMQYRQKPAPETLEKWKDVVLNTADYMADYLFYDKKTKQYVLGPPVVVVSENTDPLQTINPIFELGYFRYGLRTALEWADRLGLSCVRPMTADGRQFRPEWEGTFDLVLVDAPCSGLGVIRKKPDIRYKDPKPLENLPRVQAAILDNVADYVRPGGVLLYATCTLLGRENEGVVRAFLDKRRDFTLDGFQVSGPFLDTDTGMLTCWPHRHGTDGFFFARLRRKDDGNL